MFVLGGSQDHIHEHLEGWWRVTHSKVHYFWLEGAKTRLEVRLPLVAVLDAYIIIPPSHVEFGEDPCIFNLLYQIWDER